MSVMRTKKKGSPYVALDVTALNDPRLSFRAKGLHTYLMSKPDDWKVYIAQLEKQSPKEGREAVAGALKELENAGYIRRRKLRDSKGRMAGWDTKIYETPTLAAEDTEFEQEPLPETNTEVGKTEIGSTEIGLSEVGSTEVGKTATTYYGINKELMEPNLDNTHSPFVPSPSETVQQPCMCGKDTEAIATMETSFTNYTPGFLKVCAAHPRQPIEGKRQAFVIWQARGLEPRGAEIAEKLARLVVTKWKDRTYYPLLKTWLDHADYDDDLVPLMPAHPAGRRRPVI